MNPREIKLLTLGNSKVGKSSFILRYTENEFSIHISTTIGMDYKYKYETLDDGERVKVFLFDTNGQERFKSISFNMLKNAHGVLLFYDITDKESFDSIKEWMKNIYDIKEKDFPIVLLGNKIDKSEERVIDYKVGESEAQKYNIKFFEISCKNAINIKEPILYIISQISGGKVKEDNFILNPKREKKKKCCK